MSQPTQDARTEELRLLRDSARTLFTRAGGIARARELRASSQNYDRKMWSEMVDAGFVGGFFTEASGGLGLRLSATAVILEEAGRALAPEPLTGAAGLAGGILNRLNGPASDLAQRIARGEIIPALAWQEQLTINDSRPIETRLASGRLDGHKLFIPQADAADILLVTAVSQGEPVLCWVESGATGVRIDKRPQTDGTTLCNLSLSATQVPETHIVARGEAVTLAVQAALDEAVALVAAELVGIMSVALDTTIEYLKTRKQFGKPIGAFQALQHRAVDMAMHREVAAATLKEVLLALDNDVEPAARSLLVSRAKARASDAAMLICRESIQMHGAIGYTEECDIRLFLQRALTLCAWLGNAAEHRRRYAQLKRQRRGAYA